MMGHEPFLQALATYACTPRELAHREELMPKLIDVASLSPDAQAQVTEIWLDEAATTRPPVACAWIDCNASIDELARHIARYLVGPGENGRPVFWRYYDPRVLSLTLAVCDPAQRAALLGPAATWQFAWAGHRWAVAGPGKLEDEIDGHLSGWPRQDQWPRINRSEVAARVVDRLPLMPAEHAARVPAALDSIFSDVARRGGPADADDLADYAWHCLHYGPAFEQCPALVDTWPALARGEIGWPDAKARIAAEGFMRSEKTSRSPQT